MIALRRRPTTACPDVNTEGSWAISYGDMITLLLMFFVLFFSIDRQLKQEEKISRIEAELIGIFKSHSSDKVSSKPMETEAALMKDFQTEVHKVGQRLLIVFPGISFYRFAETDVTGNGATALGDFVHKYLPYSGSYLLGIRAFTDTKPVGPRHRYKDNLELSALRAISAMRVLQRAGIPLNRMRVGGYGENQTTADDLRKIASVETDRGDGKGEPLARKVVLVIEPEPPAAPTATKEKP